jgi:hypothetical protein
VHRILAFIAIACAPVMLAAAPFTAFRDGESFTYRVGFAIFGRAGEIKITAHNIISEDGRELMRVTTDTQSRGFVRGVYAFENRAEVLIDRKTGRAQVVRESGEDPKRASESETIFDYEKGVARHVDRVRTERSVEIPIPDGNPLDLISALVQTRDWGLKPGEKRDVLVHFQRELYELEIHAVGYEHVTTPLGRFNTLVLVPRMVKNPKGLFKRGGEIKVWIAQDGSRLPVKMQLVLKFGTATLLLTEHVPGKPGARSAAD